MPSLSDMSPLHFDGDVSPVPIVSKMNWNLAKFMYLGWALAKPF